jgi:hypothetical protein
VTRGGTRSIAVLAATALVALLLAACGSSDSGSSDSSSSDGSSTTESSAQSGGSQGGSQEQSGAGQQDGGGASGSGSQGQQGGSKDDSTGFTAEEVETPLKVSGGGSEQFTVKGGDNSIQEFGEESDESELEEAAETLHSFFLARATGDWEGACGYLSKAMTEQLEQLAKSSTGLGGKGCAAFLQAFTSKLSAAEWQEATTVDAGSLRQEGEQAFLIYYGADKTVYAMPLSVEDGQFKVGALGGDALG